MEWEGYGLYLHTEPTLLCSSIFLPFKYVAGGINSMGINGIH